MHRYRPCILTKVGLHVLPLVGARLTAYGSVFSERERAICYRPSVCRLSVCLFVTFVRPTQAIQTFGNISMALGTLAIR